VSTAQSTPASAQGPATGAAAVAPPAASNSAIGG
jgi:hypothetical protein